MQICSAPEQWLPTVVCDLLTGHTNNLSGLDYHLKSGREQIEYDRQPRTVWGIMPLGPVLKIMRLELRDALLCPRFSRGQSRGTWYKTEVVVSVAGPWKHVIVMCATTSVFSLPLLPVLRDNHPTIMHARPWTGLCHHGRSGVNLNSTESNLPEGKSITIQSI